MNYSPTGRQLNKPKEPLANAEVRKLLWELIVFLGWLAVSIISVSKL